MKQYIKDLFIGLLNRIFLKANCCQECYKHGFPETIDEVFPHDLMRHSISGKFPFHVITSHRLPYDEAKTFICGLNL